MSNYIKSYDTWREINEAMVGADKAVNIAKNHGIKLKPYSSGNPKPTKHLDKYPSGAPELVSAYSSHGSAEFESDLIDIVDKIQDETKIKFNITGGDDYFHRIHGGRHKTGEAIDFVVDRSITDDDHRAIENVIINIMKTGDYPNLGFINEYKRPSGHATAGHYHISTGKTTEYSYFHFVKDANGSRLTGKGAGFDAKLAAIGGQEKIYQGQDLEDVVVTAKGPEGGGRAPIRPITPIPTSIDNTEMPKTKNF